jgi:leucyl aminopeptidase
MPYRPTLPSAFDTVFVRGADAAAATPVWLVDGTAGLAAEDGILAAHRRWLETLGFNGAPRKFALLPGADAKLGGAVLGIGAGGSGEPCGPSELLAGLLPGLLPSGTYRLAGRYAASDTAALAFGLGAYRYRSYKSDTAPEQARLVLSAGANEKRLAAVIEGVALARDLINTPASDMGPEELEAAARLLSDRHGTSFSSIVGDALLTANFPMIHAVGRASAREPRLVDMSWGRVGAPTVTLIGKGVCFDTGGLDIKPSASMLLMKKDMGGAAAALGLAHMIMSLGLDVRLRVLLAIAENAVGGNAFRPGDVLTSRAGRTVEIGNTDAEGRLVLADALSLASEETPELMVSFATLTGAARVALGPDLPPLFCDDDLLAAEISTAGLRTGDPVWRMPFWPGYERTLDSEVADMNNVSDGPFAGAVTAALFLRRFAGKTGKYVHLDIYGWRPAPRALGPKGGEPQSIRAMLDVIAAIAERGRVT